MKKAVDLYPNAFAKKGKKLSYQPLLDSFGNIIIQVDDDGYSGDSRVLYRDGDRFGYLQFGWGSCPGCDLLQGCSSYDEIDELIEELKYRIMWFSSASECLEFFKTHDWKGDYSWGNKKQQEFVNMVINYLERELAS